MRNLYTKLENELDQDGLISGQKAAKIALEMIVGGIEKKGCDQGLIEWKTFGPHSIVSEKLVALGYISSAVYDNHEWEPSAWHTILEPGKDLYLACKEDK
jgi:hypothetical protein